MKENKLFIICVFILSLCACSSKRDILSQNNDELEFYKRYYENDVVDYYNVDKSENEKEENVNEEKKEPNNDNKQNYSQKTNGVKTDNVNEKQGSTNLEENKSSESNVDNSGKSETQPEEQPKEEPKEENPVIVNDNSVDKNNMDYPIHKGRIDCSDVEGCVNISIPIQVKYKKSISNAFYLEVIAKSGTTLGYFIQYMFIDYNYGNYDKCVSIGDDMKQTLSNKVIGYDCSSDGILKVKTNY